MFGSSCGVFNRKIVNRNVSRCNRKLSLLDKTCLSVSVLKEILVTVVLTNSKFCENRVLINFCDSVYCVKLFMHRALDL